MSKTIRIKINKPWRGLSLLGGVVGIAYLAIVLAVPLGGVMAGADELTRRIDVYFLSPRILTRIAMTPERLETDKSRVDSRVLPMPALTKLLAEIRSNSHQPTGRSKFAYDFRLCIRADGQSTCFSADGTVGCTSGEPFALSAGERDDVLNLIKELDARTSHESGQVDPSKQ
jgi:hypothetical protein